MLPGTYPLSVTRGIAFPGVVFRCADDSASVTGTLSPNVVGTFVLTGQFGGYDLFVLSGTPSTFLYYNAAAASYVIARILTTAALTDYWSPSSPITEPTGTYAPHGANTGTATATDHPLDLTGYTVQGQVRRTSEAAVTLDLNPSITNASIGEFTIPAISSDDTRDFDFVGAFNWDTVFVNGAGERVDIPIKGPFTVSDNITQPIPT